MLTPQEEKRIRRFNTTLSKKVTIEVRLSEDSRGTEFEQFCDRLVNIAPKIKMVVNGDEPESLPAIRIGPRLRYHGIPTGRELDPFLEALAYLDTKQADLPQSIKAKFTGASIPADIRVFVTPVCQFCPGVLRQILPLPFVVESISLTVIDGVLFTDLAEESKIRSAPTILLDEQFRWSGAITLDELSEAIVHRDPAMLGRPTLERLILDGGAFDLAEMMFDQGKIFPAFIDLLTDETLTVRLAAMVTAEELAAGNRELASQMIEPLKSRFQDAVDTVKGDILYILGELKSRKPLSVLNDVITGNYDAEVKEAAQEAVEKIRKG
jgi:hypothetical protein